MRMKGSAFSMFVSVTLAILAIVVLLMIFRSMIPSLFGRSFCKVYQVILVLPLPSFLKPTIPGCTITPQTERIYLNDGNAPVLATYIESCWRKSDYGKGGQGFICYEIFMKSIKENIDEVNVTKTLKERGLCEKLPNNIIDATDQKYDCGDENLIYWGIDNIKGDDVTVIIKYNAFIHRLEVF